jgi:hypothetical protein
MLVTHFETAFKLGSHTRSLFIKIAHNDLGSEIDRVERGQPLTNKH